MLISKIKKSIKKLYIKYLNNKLTRSYDNKYETRKILNNNYKVIRGTVRSKADYDEGWILFLSSKSKVVFDIGCNVGYSTLLISQSKNVNKIVVVEPNPLSLSIAAENLILNDLVSNVVFIPKAAYGKSGDKIQLWTMPGPFAAASTNIDFAESGSMANSYIDVETITLDDIAETYNLWPDLVKIDVEGVEHSVLEGSLKIAKRIGTKFIVEVHSSDSLSIVENTEKILDWCKVNNFIAYYLREHIELIDSKIIDGRGRYHLLLIHKDDQYPDGLNKIHQSEDINNIDIKYN